MAWLVNVVAPARWLTASPNHPWRSSSSDPATAMSKPAFTTWRPPPRTDVPVGQTGVSAGSSTPMSVSDCDTIAYFAAHRERRDLLIDIRRVGYGGGVPVRPQRAGR